MEIKLSIPAEKSLEHIINNNPSLGKRIFSQLRDRLPLDPYPDDPENELFHSKPFKALERAGYDIRILKSKEFFGSCRIFYIVDEPAEIIYILEIVKRDDDTYKLSSEHVKTIKDLYIRYYTHKKG